MFSSRSFCFGSSLGSLFGSFLSSSSECFVSSLAFFQHFGSFSLVSLYFLCMSSLLCSGFLVSLSLGNLLVLSLLLCLPSIETLLCLFSTESTFSDTTLEVLHQHNALNREEMTRRVSGLCTNAYPIERALKIELDGSRISVGVVRAETLNDFAVTRRAAVSNYDVVVSIVFVTVTSQTNFCCHLFFVLRAGDYANPCPWLILIMTCFFHEKAGKSTAFI